MKSRCASRTVVEDRECVCRRAGRQGESCPWLQSGCRRKSAPKTPIEASAKLPSEKWPASSLRAKTEMAEQLKSEPAKS